MPLARAGDDLMASELVDQAREWQQKDRDDIAAEVWRKLLRVNAKHPEALVKLGAIEARAGNLKEAGVLYESASKLTPPPVGLRALALAIDVAKGKPGNLATTVPPKLEPAKPAPARAEPLKPADPVKKMAPEKSLAPKADNSATVAPPKKTLTPAAVTPPTVETKPKSSQKTETDTPSLIFSESLNLAH